MKRAIRLGLAAGLIAAIPAADALAQGMVRPAPRPGAGPGAAAPALPGVAARPSPAPIAPGEGAENLSPNAALFDAIARGDLAAARSAVARGANLEARSALGLTPLDTAVDQGRHEIAFFLLTAREMIRVERPPDPRERQREARQPTVREAPVRESRAQAAVPRTARLWAGDGGAAQPDIGFLGFDAGRPAGAAGRRPTRS
jgi:hypothetical protein